MPDEREPVDADHAAPQPQCDARPAKLGTWGTALIAIVTVVAIVIVALAAPQVVGALIFEPDSATGYDKGEVSTRSWLHVLCFQLVVVMLTLVVAGPGAARSLGWRAPAGRNSWVQPFLLTVAVSVVTGVVAFTFFAEIVARDLEPIRQLVLGAPLWLSFIVLAIGAPVSEELLFRGYLLHRLKDTPLGFWVGALVANTGWAALHFNYSLLGLADVFLAGLLFSWALWRTKSIWVPIAFHALYNAVVFFVLLIPSEGQTETTASLVMPPSLVEAIWLGAQPVLGL
jgi:membrane protease YdiL (CAAX protease family)